MAGMRKKGNCWYATVRHGGVRHYFAVGELSEDQARVKAAEIDELVELVRRGMLTVPDGVSLGDFLAAGGKAPVVSARPETVTLRQMFDRYLEVHGNGTVEANTLETRRTHIHSLVGTLGERFKVQSLTMVKLQEHVDRRARSGRSPHTIRQEVATFRACWNWAVVSGVLSGTFPNKGLRYPKEQEKEPFRTLAEIEAATLREGLTEADARYHALWESLYLTKSEVEDLLVWVREHGTLPWVYPMVATAAYTGARRSELLRMLVSDVDLSGGTVNIREKKRVKGRRSMRTAPLVPRLQEILRAWIEVKPPSAYLFCQAQGVSRSKTKRSGPTPITRDEAHDHLRRSVAESRWRHMRGWHVLRHSFISTCVSRGVDQRLLMQWTGHLDERTSRRYAHLWPSTQQEALLRVFE